jgi:hypothetical protein
MWVCPIVEFLVKSQNSCRIARIGSRRKCDKEQAHNAQHKVNHFKAFLKPAKMPKRSALNLRVYVLASK